MAITKIVFKRGRGRKNTGLVEVVDENHGKGRGKSKFHSKPRDARWYDFPPTGSPDELQRAWIVAEDYLFKLISYAEREEPLSKEELDEARNIFKFVKQGPKAHHFTLAKISKLTSADVLYILTTSLPSTKVAELYGMSSREIQRVRRGEIQTWEWEYRLIKRLKAILRNKREYLDKTKYKVYRVSKVTGINQKEDLLFSSSLRRAKELRKSLIPVLEFKKLTNNKTLDILYPIDQIEIL